MSKKRKICEHCRINTITQGSIFNFAFNEDYPDPDSLGLLISARCDIENNKGTKFSYLPVIPLESFIQSAITEKILNEEIKSEIGKISGFIKNSGNTPDAINMYGAEAAIKTLLKKPKEIEKANEACERIQRIESLLNIEWRERGYVEPIDLPPKKVKSELQAIANNRVEGIFLLDQVIDFNNNEQELGPHIVLLREIYHIESDTCEKIKIGCLHDDLNPNKVRSLNLQPGEMSYVLCNVISPYIELLMQRFSNLFTRIGVQDPNVDLLNTFVDTRMVNQ